MAAGPILLNFLEQCFSNLMYVRIILKVDFLDSFPRDFDLLSLGGPGTTGDSNVDSS